MLSASKGNWEETKVWISQVMLDGKPVYGNAIGGNAEHAFYPSHARMEKSTYASELLVRLSRQVGDGPVKDTMHKLGQFPIMVGSKICWSHGQSPAELVEMGEETTETGGYFIVNGGEKLIRLLILNRRNYPVCLTRSAFHKRGNLFTDKGIMIRCVREDAYTMTNLVHYLKNGEVSFRVLLRRKEYFIPMAILMRALRETTDLEMFEHVVNGDYDNTYLVSRVEIMLRSGQNYGVYTQTQALAFLGLRFRPLLMLPREMTDADAGRVFIKRHVFVHYKEDLGGRFPLAVLMLQKLYAHVQGEILNEGLDAASQHEVMDPGYFLQVLLRENLQRQLTACISAIRRAYQRGRSMGHSVNVESDEWWTKVMARITVNIGDRIRYMLSTGNLPPSGNQIDLPQENGFVIGAEKLNAFRYLAHFRCVHRGAYFTQMRTTKVRKLLPESYGFLCPVNTPDGTPCGLLNHLAAKAELSNSPSDEEVAEDLVPFLAAIGVRLISEPGRAPPSHVVVMLDGKVIGSVHHKDAATVTSQLRHAKVLPSTPQVPNDLEIVNIPSELLRHVNAEDDDDNNNNNKGGVKGKEEEEEEDDGGVVDMDEEEREGGEEEKKRKAAAAAVAAAGGGSGDVAATRRPGRFPGVFLFSSAGRFLRPVLNLAEGVVEMIGSLEQTDMHIAVLPDDVRPGVTTHADERPTDMLSLIAQLTPFSDCNQSPRNMYQCQMGKQTMGTPVTVYEKRTDNKLYRIQTPQAPIVRTKTHTDYKLDTHPQGQNAVIAVISYTGYDMEDAMIINKQSLERGFTHGTMYKTEIVDLTNRDSDRGVGIFSNLNEKGEVVEPELDTDGLPRPGTYMVKGSPYYSMRDPVTGKIKVKSFKYKEPAVVDKVRILRAYDKKNRGRGLVRVCITLRFNRTPVIGDKFSSRHGQKGTLSQIWPAEDMPFTESGITPDIIINPHAFPSRMTIGMLIEIMAAKSGALFGKFQDSTPFSFLENGQAHEFFGEQLKEAGFSFYGNEPMYSGTYGEEMGADIFFGVCYYQRLKHMLLDKYQARARGPVDDVTRQPVKGRKRGGGVRFGEMERDSLISHGASALLQDRLLKCSDTHDAFVCARCGSLASISHSTNEITGVSTPVCDRKGCDGGDVHQVELPYVFRYLVAELASMGIAMELDVESV